MLGIQIIKKIMLETILIQKILIVVLLIFTALSGRLILILAGQHWVKTFAHTATLLFLPIITFVITTVISGNIALSLGMVGALSIVRFRNPVRSPFELCVYFACITMGITASVSLNWLLFLVGALLLAIFTLGLVDKLSKIFRKKSYFDVSFTEGNSLSTLELTSKNQLDELIEDSRLISFTKNDNLYNYILCSTNSDLLKKISKDMIKNPNIDNVQFNA